MPRSLIRSFVSLQRPDGVEKSQPGVRGGHRQAAAGGAVWRFLCPAAAEVPGDCMSGWLRNVSRSAFCVFFTLLRHLLGARVPGEGGVRVCVAPGRRRVQVTCCRRWQPGVAPPKCSGAWVPQRTLGLGPTVAGVCVPLYEDQRGWFKVPYQGGSAPAFLVTLFKYLWFFFSCVLCLFLNPLILNVCKAVFFNPCS